MLNNNLNEMDRWIAEGLLDGNKDAYRELSDRYSGYIYSECVYYCNDKDEALDLLNEILIRIVISIGSFDYDKSRLATWVKNVTGNYLKNYLKKQQEDPDVLLCAESDLDLFPSHYPSPEEHAEQAEEAESGKKYRKKRDPDLIRLRKAMSGLSRRDRQILLYRAEGFDYESIGSFLKMNPGTAMTAWSRATKKVKERFGREL